MDALDIINPRIDRMENIIERLAEVSADIKQMLAVHEQKLEQHSKYHDYVDDLIESRRRDVESKIDAVYDTMRAQDNNVLDEIRKLREESVAQHEKMTEKIAKLEKYIWMAIGATGVVSWLISYGAPGVMKIMGH